MAKTRLKELREEKGILQKDLAKELNVNSRTISNWERGYCEPDIDAIKAIAKFFGVTTDYLLFVTDY